MRKTIFYANVLCLMVRNRNIKQNFSTAQSAHFSHYSQLSIINGNILYNVMCLVFCRASGENGLGNRLQQNGFPDSRPPTGIAMEPRFPTTLSRQYELFYGCHRTARLQYCSRVWGASVGKWARVSCAFTHVTIVCKLVYTLSIQSYLGICLYCISQLCEI